MKEGVINYNKLQKFYGRSNVFSCTRSRRLKWLGHVRGGYGQTIKQALVAEMKEIKDPSRPWVRRSSKLFNFYILLKNKFFRFKEQYRKEEETNNNLTSNNFYY